MLMTTDDKQAAENRLSSEHLIQRSSVRSIRRDLKVYLTHYRFLNASPLKIKLIDISSRGVQVAATIKIRIKKLLVNFFFPDGYKFEINGKIVRHQKKQSHLYDLKFNPLDHYIDTENVTFNNAYLLVSKALVKNKYRNITSHSIQVLTDERINNKNVTTRALQPERSLQEPFESRRADYSLG